MTNLLIRLPDDIVKKLKNVARMQSISLDKLMIELAKQVLVEEETTGHAK